LHGLRHYRVFSSKERSEVALFYRAARCQSYICLNGRAMRMRGNAIARNTIRGNGSRHGAAFTRLSSSKTSKASMAQSIYDRPEFFEGYSRLARSVAGLSGAPEWAALKAMLPQVRGRRVVDLGCGFGWFCRWAAEQGASEVLGLDLSQKMLARARAETPQGVISYQVADLEALDLGEGSADLIYSSLAFHYVADAARLYASIHKALALGGHLVFSTEHPIFMASTRPGWREARARREDLAGRSLFFGGCAQHRLAERRRRQIPPYRRHDPQHDHPSRLHDHACRGVLPDTGADRREPGACRGVGAANVPARFRHAVSAIQSLGARRKSEE
jgi:SAM-dependent methyltransferase